MSNFEELGLQLKAVRTFGRVRYVIGPRDSRADSAEDKAIRRFRRRALRGRLLGGRLFDCAMVGALVALLLWFAAEWLR